jgi:hypothetical protein
VYGEAVDMMVEAYFRNVEPFGQHSRIFPELQNNSTI